MFPILYVEDDGEIASLVRDALDGVAAVDSVSTIREARAMLGAAVYDLLLVDLSLPDARDVEAVDALVVYRIPIVVVTATQCVDTLRRAAQAGAVDYIVKPMTPSTLVDRVVFAHARHVEAAAHPVRTTVGRRIGESTFERLKPFITCSRAPFERESRAPLVVA